MANLEQDADVAQWSRGFVAGHSWLEETWEASGELGATVDEHLGSLLFVLSFFSKRSLAEGYVRELAAGSAWRIWRIRSARPSATHCASTLR